MGLLIIGIVFLVLAVAIPVLVVTALSNSHLGDLIGLFICMVVLVALGVVLIGLSGIAHLAPGLATW